MNAYSYKLTCVVKETKSLFIFEPSCNYKIDWDLFSGVKEELALSRKKRRQIKSLKVDGATGRRRKNVPPDASKNPEVSDELFFLKYRKDSQCDRILSLKDINPEEELAPIRNPSTQTKGVKVQPMTSPFAKTTRYKNSKSCAGIQQ